MKTAVRQFDILSLFLGVFLTSSLSVASSGDFRHPVKFKHRETSSPSDFCPIPFEKKIKAFKTSGSSQTYFDLRQLEFLFSPLYKVENIYLEVNLKDRLPETVKVSLNGFKFRGPAGEEKRTHVHLKLHKSELQIGLIGKHGKITDANLVFQGIERRPCTPATTTTTTTTTITVTTSTSTTTTTTTSTTTLTLPPPTTTSTTTSTTTTTVTLPPTTTTTTTLPPPPTTSTTTTSTSTTTTTTTTTTLPDVTPPVLQLDSENPAETLTASSQRQFQFSANETGRFECALDNENFAPCTSPVNLGNLAEGSHSFEIRAFDEAGNQSLPIRSAWRTDYTAPQVQLGTLLPAPGLSNSSQIHVEFFTNEPAQVYCALNGQPAQTCSSPYQLQDLANGIYQLEIFAVDQVGHQSTRTSLQWEIDSTAPVISFTSIEPSAASILRAESLSLAVQVSKPASLLVSVNGSTPAPSGNPVQLSNLQEGTYFVQITARDPAGNLSNTLTHTFAIDRTAPVLTVTPSIGTLTRLDSVSFEFSSSEESRFECSLDQKPFESCQSLAVYTGLLEGSHSWVLRATDLAGNISQSQFSWNQDSQAPVVQNLSTLTTRNSITVTWTTTEAATSQAIYGVSPNLSITTEESTSLQTSHTLQLTGLTANTLYSVQVFGKDAAGNVYRSAVLSIRTNR